MRRPKDIQQDIWEKAGWLVDAVVRQALVHNAPDSQTIIARAIMAATGAARENFLTMQGTAAKLAVRVTELEAALAAESAECAAVAERYVDPIDIAHHIRKRHVNAAYKNKLEA